MLQGWRAERPPRGRPRSARSLGRALPAGSVSSSISPSFGWGSSPHHTYSDFPRTPSRRSSAQPRSGRPRTAGEGTPISSGIMFLMYSFGRLVALVYIRQPLRHRGGAQAIETPGRLGGGGYRQAWLNEIVTHCNAPTTFGCAANGHFVRRGNVL